MMGPKFNDALLRALCHRAMLQARKKSKLLDKQLEKEVKHDTKSDRV